MEVSAALSAAPAANASGAIKRPASSANTPGLAQAVRQFEAIFVGMMLKAARAATAVIAADSPFRSFEGDMHQEMLDQELANALSEQGGIGLREVLMRQLQPKPDDAHARPATDAVAASHPRRGHVANARSAPVVEARTVRDGLFDSPAAFVDGVLPVIERLVAGTTLPPLGLLAQAALETGWGSRVVAAGDGSSHNLFGIKAGGNWQGSEVAADTVEVASGIARRERARFRAYADVASSVRDVVNLLTSSPRYAGAQAAQTPVDYVRAVAAAGYATDPDYARKMERVLGHPAIVAHARRLEAR